MKYLKMLGLAAVAAMALMAFVGAGTASAAKLCTNATCTTQMAVNDSLHAVSEGHVTLVAGFATVECNSTVEGKITATGGAGASTGNITKLEWTNCTNNCTAVTKVLGTLEVTALGSDNGTVTGKGSTVTVTCAGVSCNFGTAAAGTDLGTLTGSKNTTKTSTLDINAKVPWITGDSSSFICTAGTGTGTWKGTYEITTPDYLDVT